MVEEKHWKGASLFALDFDGGLNYEAYLAKCEKLSIRFYFTYETFSSHKKSKFRGVFVCSNFLEDFRLWSLVNNIFKKVFPEEADTLCFDPTHMFYGGKNIIDRFGEVFSPHFLVANFENYLRTMDSNHGKRKFKNFLVMMGSGVQVPAPAPCISPAETTTYVDIRHKAARPKSLQNCVLGTQGRERTRPIATPKLSYHKARKQYYARFDGKMIYFSKEYAEAAQRFTCYGGCSPLKLHAFGVGMGHVLKGVFVATP